MSDGYPHGESHPTDSQADDGWCSVNEAARRLGVTPTAIRNRIKRRTLKTKPNGNHGHLVWVPRPVSPTVPLNADGTVTSTVSPTVPETMTPTVLGTVDPLVPELRGRIGELQTRLSAAQDELIAMARNLGAAQSEITALQAQAAEARADRDAWRLQAERLATPAPHRPWWWRRLAG